MRVTPKGGKLHAQITPGVDAGMPETPPVSSPPPPSPSASESEAPTRRPRLSVVVSPPPLEATTAAPGALPAEFADDRMEGASRQLGEMLRALVMSQSSDLHLRVDEPPIFRTHGEINRHGTGPLSPEQIDLLMLSIMPERNRLEWRETGDTDFAYEIAGLARFRVNAARDRKGSVGVFRVIPAKVVTVEEMGISSEVQKLCYLVQGAGAGDGAHRIGQVDHAVRADRPDQPGAHRPHHHHRRSDRVRPREQEVPHHAAPGARAHRGVQVGVARRLARGSGYRAGGRNARPGNRSHIALETAETGHLVFGTLHTTTAPSTIDRIIDQFPADRQSQIRTMLSDSLKGVVAQTLCKKVGGGRVAAREILLTTPAISNLIREAKTFQIPSIIQTSKKIGMITLNDALLELVEKKLVEPDEAYMKAVEKATFAQQLKAKGFKLSVVLEG